MEDKVLAIVGGQEITEKELNDLIEKYPENRRGFFKTENGKKQLLGQVIDFELIYQFGKKNGFENSKEYIEQVEKLKKEILTQMIINKTLAEVTVTDEEALNYYNANQDKFSEPETVSAKHILVDSEEECNKVRKEILDAKVTFEEAAAKYSTCPSGAEGGNLGAFSKGMMVPEFEKAAFELAIGELSEAVKTQFGYHLIKVELKNPASIKSFDEVKNTVLNQLVQERQQKKYLDFVKELAGEYGVDRKI